MVTPSNQPPFVLERRIVLLVEDRVTKGYLTEAWGPDEQYFNIRPVGGSSTVKGMVEELRGDEPSNVFGFVDRDFGDTNYAKWSRINGPPVLQASFHEIENVLLDWPALAGCGINQNLKSLSADEIEAKAMIEAHKQPWWLACRKCLASRQRNFVQASAAGPVRKRTIRDNLNWCKW